MDQATLVRIFQKALDSQGACNATGVLRSFAEDLMTLRQEDRSKGTDYWNQHPIAVLYLEQLSYLSGCSLMHPRYSAADRWCRAVTDGKVGPLDDYSTHPVYTGNSVAS